MRLLVVEDLTVDAAALLTRPPLQAFLHGTASVRSEWQFKVPMREDSDEDGGIQAAFGHLSTAPIALIKGALPDESEDIEDFLAGAKVVVVSDTESALALLRRAKFDLVISDLFLFRNADELWAKYGNKYDEHVAFDEEVLPQIMNPNGLGFVERQRTSSGGVTPASVPIIVMTFFWNHPRFEQYKDRLGNLKLAPLAYLPKYYKFNVKGKPIYAPPTRLLGEKADYALTLLLELMLPENPTVEVRRFVPFSFDYVATLLHVNGLEPRLHDGFDRLRSSLDRLCHAFVNASLEFDLSKACDPPPPGVTNEFEYIAQKILSTPQIVASVRLGVPARS